MEGGRLKRSPQLVEGKDYVMVPEPVWRALYHWYGANLSLPRPVRCDYRHCCLAVTAENNKNNLMCSLLPGSIPKAAFSQLALQDFSCRPLVLDEAGGDHRRFTFCSQQKFC